MSTETEPWMRFDTPPSDEQVKSLMGHGGVIRYLCLHLLAERRELDECLERFTRYGRHDDTCPYLANDPYLRRGCECGFEGAEFELAADGRVPVEREPRAFPEDHDPRGKSEIGEAIRRREGPYGDWEGLPYGGR